MVAGNNEHQGPIDMTAQPPHQSDADIARAVRVQLSPLSRRGFLEAAVAAAAVASVPVGGCGLRGAAVPMGLGPDHDIFKQLLSVFLPTAPETKLLPTSEVPVLENLDTLLLRFPPDLRRDLGTGLRLFDYGAIFIGFHFKSFSSLDDEAATAYCRRWEQGNTTQRGLMHALRQIIFSSYWREPATWPPIGYDGPVTAPYRIPSLGNAPLPLDDEDEHHAD